MTDHEFNNGNKQATVRPGRTESLFAGSTGLGRHVIGATVLHLFPEYACWQFHNFKAKLLLRTAVPLVVLGKCVMHGHRVKELWAGAQIIKAEMVLWTAGFVLLTLVINAPLLPYVLRWTGLSKGACCAPDPAEKGHSANAWRPVRDLSLLPKLHQIPYGALCKSVMGAYTAPPVCSARPTSTFQHAA